MTTSKNLVQAIQPTNNIEKLNVGESIMQYITGLKVKCVLLSKSIINECNQEDKETFSKVYAVEYSHEPINWGGIVNTTTKTVVKNIVELEFITNNEPYHLVKAIALAFSSSLAFTDNFVGTTVSRCGIINLEVNGNYDLNYIDDKLRQELKQNCMLENFSSNFGCDVKGKAFRVYTINFIKKGYVNVPLLDVVVKVK